MEIQKIRTSEPKVLVIGNYPIVQTILDFDFFSGKSEPSIKAILASGKNFSKFFFGTKEIVIPNYESFDVIPEKLKKEIKFFQNLTSGRRCYTSSLEALEHLPNLIGGTIFAEDTPERFSIDLFEKAKEKNVFIIGPASVGLLLPNHLKLGAIGGVRTEQLVQGSVFDKGNVAVFSSSGGMTNELINLVVKNGKRISFSLSFGGDKFPIFRPVDAFLAAEKDKETEFIVYFGELGGYDEYEIINLIKKKKITKPIIAYIAGLIGDAFDKPTQFGHAKALAKKGEETAKGKRKALNDVGVIAPDSFKDFISAIQKIKTNKFEEKKIDLSIINSRRTSLFTSSIVNERDGDVYIVGTELGEQAEKYSFANIAVSMLLGKRITSKKIEDFSDLVFKLLVDHGPNVSGVVNTMITSRAGKDMVSSLVTGLLTIGPRFGGAINEAAFNWLNGVNKFGSAKEFVEDFSKNKKYILGIGHRKYRIDMPDPRVKKILEFSKDLKNSSYTKFALEVEKITTSKKGNLILNVDGAVGAVLLDLLASEESYSKEELYKLTQAEFFNAFFVIPRTVGFLSHYLDQKRLDEGLFRLDDGLVAQI